MFNSIQRSNIVNQSPGVPVMYPGRRPACKPNWGNDPGNQEAIMLPVNGRHRRL